MLGECRSYERLTIRQDKIICGLKFLVSCRKEKLIPKFAKPKISIKAPKKVKLKIGQLIVQTEIKNNRYVTGFYV